MGWSTLLEIKSNLTDSKVTNQSYSELAVIINGEQDEKYAICFVAYRLKYHTDLMCKKNYHIQYYNNNYRTRRDMDN